MSPLVSIAIPTFSRAEYLLEALGSSLAQQYRNVEILISDDGNSSQIRAVGQHGMAQDARVRYWRNRENLGLAGNWNRCAEESRGKYILIIGDDDRLTPLGVASLVLRLEEGDDVVFGNHHLIDQRGARLPFETQRASVRYGRDELKAGYPPNAEAVVWRNSIPMCAALVRTEWVRSVRFKEELNTPELVLFAEMARAGATFKFVPEFVSEYRVHNNSATSRGLWNDNLVARLIEMPVLPETEVCKAKLLKPLLVDGIKKRLAKGDVRSARKLSQSRYVSSFSLRDFESVVVRGCLRLPGSGPALAYKALRAIASSLKAFVRISKVYRKRLIYTS